MQKEDKIKEKAKEEKKERRISDNSRMKEEGKMKRRQIQYFLQSKADYYKFCLWMIK